MQEATTRKTQTLPDSDVCPICHNTGFEFYKDGNYEYARECSCGLKQRERMKNRLRFANIPEAFKDMDLKTFSINVYKKDESKNTIRNACSSIKYWLENLDNMKANGKGLYLYSMKKGSGKTRMAASIANELMNNHNCIVKFASSIQIINEIKATWDNDRGISESKLLEYLSDTEILIIDDFGTESVKDWIGERFYSIINGRYVDNKITIFTSNMSIEDLQYDDRITNRIKERNYLIPFPEESVRELKAEQNREEIEKNRK